MRDLKFFALRLADLRLEVNLGCTEAERARRQEVRVTVELRFSEAPAGMTSDRLEETVCYAELSQKIVQHCERREYHLIERLGAEIYALVRELAGGRATIGVSAHKVRPPVERLEGGTFFRCGDFAL